MKSDRIIVPLDVPELEDAINLVKLLPMVSFWKVGLELFIAAGPEILAYLKGEGKSVFLDLKLHDIPNTMAGACRSALKYEVDLLTLHASAGRAALQYSLKSIEQKPLKLLGVTVLTSLSAQDLAISMDLADYVLSLALLCKEVGLAGSICSPLELNKLRPACGDDFLLICPGIRPSWSYAGDQKRTMTPAQALSCGADYLVIGRPITADANPTLAWSKLVEELEENS